MKIAVRGGHCPKVPGARAILDELIEDRKVKEIGRASCRERV